MKKLNATNAIVILSLGLTLSVFVAGCGGGNDTNELKVKNGTTSKNDKTKNNARCQSLSKTDPMYTVLSC